MLTHQIGDSSNMGVMNCHGGLCFLGALVFIWDIENRSVKICWKCKAPY